MRNGRWEILPGSGPLLSGGFSLTLMLSLMGLPLAVFAVFWRLEHEVWIPWLRFPAYGHGVALLWLLGALYWAQGQERRLAEGPKGVDEVYQHRQLEDQRNGITLVLWGTIAGAWLAMIAGWILAHYFR